MKSELSVCLPPAFQMNAEGTVFTGVCLSTPGGHPISIL